MYKSTAVFLLLVALGSEVESGDAGDPGPSEYESGISAGFAREQDPGGGPDLDGYRIAFTAFSQGTKSKHGFVGSWYLEWKESRVQRVLEGGAELSYPYFRFSRVGLGPRVRLAIQERAEPPDRGTDGVLGAGFELGVWLSERVQLAALVDRSVGLAAGARTSYSANLRVILWNP